MTKTQQGGRKIRADLRIGTGGSKRQASFIRRIHGAIDRSAHAHTLKGLSRSFSCGTPTPTHTHHAHKYRFLFDPKRPLSRSGAASLCGPTGSSRVVPSCRCSPLPNSPAAATVARGHRPSWRQGLPQQFLGAPRSEGYRVAPTGRISLGFLGTFPISLCPLRSFTYPPLLELLLSEFQGWIFWFCPPPQPQLRSRSETLENCAKQILSVICLFKQEDQNKQASKQKSKNKNNRPIPQPSQRQTLHQIWTNPLKPHQNVPVSKMNTMSGIRKRNLTQTSSDVHIDTQSPLSFPGTTPPTVPVEPAPQPHLYP